jgi:hypothetical protein
MPDDRKQPGVAFWATVALVVVLVGYPLSFGPACWWFSTTEQLRLACDQINRPAYVTIPECCRDQSAPRSLPTLLNHRFANLRRGLLQQDRCVIAPAVSFCVLH